MTNKSWWTRCEPNTDLTAANEEIGFMREDWQKVGHAFGFQDFVDPEVVISKAESLTNLHTQTLMLKVDLSDIARRMESDTGVLVQIMAEREAQDKQWSGPEHDDIHSQHDWMSYIEHQVAKWRATTDLPDGQVPVVDDYRERLVKIAALAVAAIQAEDRYNAPKTVDMAKPEPKRFGKAEFLALLDDAIADESSFISFSVHYWPGSSPFTQRIGDATPHKGAVEMAHDAGRAYLGDFHGAQYSVAIGSDHSITIEGNSR